MAKKDLLFEIFKNLPREGPGDDVSTKQAFSLLKNLPAKPRILDIGCGSGMQTLMLARLTNGSITCVDSHQQYLDKLTAKARQQGFSEKIETRVGDMTSLSFQPESFDVIWAEGSIYIIGLEEGLIKWGSLLKQGGYIVFSHITWLRNDIPEEPQSFWQKNYPRITTKGANLKEIERVGYENVEQFVLPPSAWWEHYYTPLEKRLTVLRKKYADQPDKLNEINETQVQIDLYRKYSDYYGYVFYIARKK